jgi:hypothetical protein
LTSTSASLARFLEPSEVLASSLLPPPSLLLLLKSVASAGCCTWLLGPPAKTAIKTKKALLVHHECNADKLQKATYYEKHYSQSPY